MDALEYEPPQAPQLDDFPAETSPVPWETLEDFPSPIIGCDYGYLRGRRLKCCPLEKLRKLCRRTGTGHPDLVWTPEHDHLVAPQEAWALQKAERRHLRTAALTWLLLGLLLGTMAYFLMDFAWDELKRPLDPWTPWGMREITREMQTRRFQLALLALFTTGVVPVIVGVRKLWRLGFHTARELARQATACPTRPREARATGRSP